MKTKTLKIGEVLLVDGRQFPKEQAYELCKQSKAKICVWCPNGVDDKPLEYVELKQLEGMLLKVIELKKNE